MTEKLIPGKKHRIVIEGVATETGSRDLEGTEVLLDVGAVE